MNMSPTSMQEILNSLPHGITIQDLQGKVTYANSMALTLMGFSSEQDFFSHSSNQLYNKFKVMDERGLPMTFDRLPGRRALISGKPEEAILLFKSEFEKNERWSWVKATPLKDSDNTVSGVL